MADVPSRADDAACDGSPTLLASESGLALALRLTVLLDDAVDGMEECTSLPSGAVPASVTETGVFLRRLGFEGDAPSSAGASPSACGCFLAAEDVVKHLLPMYATPRPHGGERAV